MKFSYYKLYNFSLDSIDDMTVSDLNHASLNYQDIPLDDLECEQTNLITTEIERLYSLIAKRIKMKKEKLDLTNADLITTTLGYSPVTDPYLISNICNGHHLKRKNPYLLTDSIIEDLCNVADPNNPSVKNYLNFTKYTLIWGTSSEFNDVIAFQLFKVGIKYLLLTFAIEKKKLLSKTKKVSSGKQKAKLQKEKNEINSKIKTMYNSLFNCLPFADLTAELTNNMVNLWETADPIEDSIKNIKKSNERQYSPSFKKAIEALFIRKKDIFLNIHQKFFKDKNTKFNNIFDSFYQDELFQIIKDDAHYNQSGQFIHMIRKRINMLFESDLDAEEELYTQQVLGKEFKLLHPRSPDQINQLQKNKQYFEELMNQLDKNQKSILEIYKKFH